ncbi:MAG: bifunctional phosphoribosyl-AMP cyclohydrolase/phosphoribosyl-ATP diphosphatase HisIE [Bacteroidales bacterium]|jgi:phosphoribosyl-ATP pyrophosphohydrolase/phosphoribosyl-AMP cyclohydrolase|nr:bifunctional phosphoribosyl-AMP cyclohydrolase/phosphoribosyl-ATP diphosphatase HisIE [Bacteroidales bacterium]MCI2121820.1 bifunctional phosphoribosyl-AMP cyclohydrolase/phosphoribosyl-ATP diphosphatase HisIE [Bacteroidales bacterium]MCI2146051.1 bifunctional phosphoribosyl-AMP cyclohydrolase/phosphoribosyl-ATP diphosphatase HisIE [Bacteroidales bacterium]
MEYSDFNVEKNSDGLLPAVIQDSRTLKVLMVGYMNREAFERTLSTGLVTFWSRSRKKLWTKGETSGNFLHLVSAYPDCDADTLLVKAVPDGPVCHRGTVSCFDTPENEGFIRELEEVIKDRHAKMPDGSYTASLFRQGVKRCSQKVGEEAVETVVEAVAGDRDRFIYEASDLVYHLLVLLEQQRCSLADIETELAGRHK